MKKLLTFSFASLFVISAFGETTVTRSEDGKSRVSITHTTVISSRTRPDVVDSAEDKDFDSENDYVSPKRSERSRRTSSKTYALNDPFFQPSEGKFASVTDFSYSENSLNLSISSIDPAWNQGAKYTAGTTSIVENLSFGITDDIAIVGMARFASNSLKINWNDPTTIDDKDSNSKIDLWGVGAQWKFVDSGDWVANVFAAYERQVDSVGIWVAELKAGHKSGRSTFYGLGRLFLMNWDSDYYGLGLENQYDQTTIFTLNEDVSVSTWYDLGVGIYTAIDKEWSTDFQLVYSDAEWHNQLSARASVSFQPLNNIAFNLYGKASLFDTADNFDDSYVIFQNNTGPAILIGTAEFDDYVDWTVGLQLVATF